MSSFTFSSPDLHVFKLWEETRKQCNEIHTQYSRNVIYPSHIYFTETHTSTNIYNHGPAHTHIRTTIHLSISLSLSCCLLLCYISQLCTHFLGASTCWKERSVDNCLLLPCHQTTLSHFTASLILRHPCQEMTFNFHTSSLCYSFFHEFYFRAHPQCIGCLAVSISVTVWESLTQMNTPTIFVFLPLAMYYVKGKSSLKYNVTSSLHSYSTSSIYIATSIPLSFTLSISLY